ncbi:MAG: family 10 glycosylhydrolase [Gemmatimonadetes bacterium]|nr:family 10 glycosylhydrolase [Gemmatimonadota bacterium]
MSHVPSRASRVIRLLLAAPLLLGAHRLSLATLGAQPATPAVAASSRAADAPPAVLREFRGAWVASVANIDWPSKPGLSAWEQQAELIALLDRARALRLNAILLQVRPAADALYASKLEPWSAYLTGVEGRAPEPYYDPLTFAVREAHARGLELHAWFNPYRAKHPSATGTHARNHVSVARPGWVRRYGGFEWMDPGEPAVLSHTLDVMLDVVKRYDVDGIHVDDYFYPYPETRDSVEVPFPDSVSYARYRARGGTLDRSDWRRHNVDEFVRRLYARTKAAKPWVKVGISPFGIWRPGYPESIKGFDSFEKLAGDSRKWINEGWVDYFTPQLYWPIAQQAQSYPVLLNWWLSENTKRRHMWPGHNSSRAAQGGTWGPTELNDQVRATRATVGTHPSGLGATGDIFFSMRSLMPVAGATRSTVSVGVATQPPTPQAAAAMADRLRDELYSEPALVPASPWLGRTAPAVPVARLVRDSLTREQVVVVTPPARTRWLTVRVLRGGAWTAHVLPAAFTRLVVGPLTGPPLERVVVTAVDRNGNESAARTLASLAPDR